MQLEKMNGKRCVWIDLETTGLIPEDGVILEVSMIITDEKFRLISEHSYVVDHRGVDIESMCDDYVRTMHTQNGLFLACRCDGNPTLKDIEDHLIFWLTNRRALQAPLCGNSVHTDAQWMLRHMPKLMKHIHYRIFDASSMRIGSVAVGGNFPKSRDSNHRAIDDIRASIALAKVALDYGFGWQALWAHVRAMGRVVLRMLRVL